MKIKDWYIMKKLGAGYVVVTVGQASKDFNGLIRFNPAGAFLWDTIRQGADTREKVIDAMLARYEDLDEAGAEQDLDEFLEKVSFALED